VCRGYVVQDNYDSRWLTRLWTIQSKVEGILLKAAWYWGSDGSVVNDPLGVAGYTPLYVGLPSEWGSVGGDHVFFLFHRRAL